MRRPDVDLLSFCRQESQRCGLIGRHHWNRSARIVQVLPGLFNADREPRIGSRLGTFPASRSACVRPTGARAFFPAQICVVATVTLELPESDVGCRMSLLAAKRKKVIA
jgi:hypothetical protein